MKKLLKEKHFNDYKKFLLSRLTSVAGDSLQEIAIIVLIATYTNSVWITGCVTGLNALVRIIGSILVIKIKSRLSVKKTLVKLNYLYFGITFLFFILI